MSHSSDWVAWVSGVALAIPAAGLFLAGKFTDGLVSTGSFVLLFAYVGIGIGYGCRIGSRALDELEDDLPDRDGPADQGEES
ncbi:MAG: hypothetical protein ACJAUC_003539 [Planctomycetota bacterium]|jgi:hypothetical protein